MHAYGIRAWILCSLLTFNRKRFEFIEGDESSGINSLNYIEIKILKMFFFPYSYYGKEIGEFLF